MPAKPWPQTFSKTTRLLTASLTERYPANHFVQIWAFGVVLSLAIALPLSATAQQNPVDRKAAEKQLQERKSKLDETKKRASELKGGLTELEQERSKLNQKLVDMAGLIQTSEARMTTIEERLTSLKTEEQQVRGTLSRRHNEISKLLGALQRMGRNPPPVMITKRKDALEMVRSAMLLSAAFPSLRKQATTLSLRLQSLVRVMTERQQEAAKLRAETNRLSKARTQLASVMAKKKQTLVERQAELKRVRLAAAQITRSVDNLNDLITNLDKAVIQNTELGKYDRELARNAASQSSTQAPPSQRPARPGTPATTPGEKDVALITPPKRDQIIEIAPPSAGFNAANPSRMTPAIPFIRTKGQLRLPATGKRIISFGEKTQRGSRSKGMVLETRFAAQITAPSDGWVVYAGKFRSYGKLLIINAGGGYHVLLAGLSNIDVEPGQFILASEPVGTMNSALTGASTSGQNKNAPVLYIEFRKNGRPINPDPWWVARHQKAS